MLEPRVVPSVLQVTATSGTGSGSLPAAITQANTDSANGISDTIEFTSFGTTATTITLPATQTLTLGTGTITIGDSTTATQAITIESGGGSGIPTPPFRSPRVPVSPSTTLA